MSVVSQGETGVIRAAFPAYRVAPGARQPVGEGRRKVWLYDMAAHILAILIAGTALGPVAAAEPDRTAAANAVVAKTGKERLTDKASDEQRTDDCKVPQGRRTRARPTQCPSEAGD